MSPLDVATVAIGLINLASSLCRLDPMTLRTHHLQPQALFTATALVAICCATLAAYGLASQAAVVLQLCTSAVLLHTLPEWRHGPPPRALLSDCERTTR